MTQLQKYTGKSALTDLRASLQQFFSGGANKYSEVFETLSRQAVPFGGNWIEREHSVSSSFKKQNTDRNTNGEFSENRYSVLYLRNDQYHHVGCSTQAEAQSVLGRMMTDEDRIPVGIYDQKTDTFEWEIIGQYFHSKDSEADQQERYQHILTIARALRRRDGSWQPGYLQRPSFFA